MPHPADRHDPSGLYETREAPPQIIDVVVESGAMRSRSEGLIPTVLFKFTDDAGGTYEAMMRCDGPEVLKVVEDVQECVVHARRDVEASRPGKGKSHGKG